MYERTIRCPWCDHRATIRHPTFWAWREAAYQLADHAFTDHRRPWLEFLKAA